MENAEQRTGASNDEVIRVRAEGMRGSYTIPMSEGEFSTHIREGYFWSIAGGWTPTEARIQREIGNAAEILVEDWVERVEPQLNYHPSRRDKFRSITGEWVSRFPRDRRRPVYDIPEHSPAIEDRLHISYSL